MTEAALTRAPFVPGIRLIRLLWRMMGPLAVAANLVVWPLLLGASEDIKHQANVAALFVIGFAFVSSLITEILSPRNKDLRCIKMADHQAERLSAIVRALAIILLGTELAIYLVRANGWSESVASLLALLRTLGLIAFGYAFVSRSRPLRALIPQNLDSYKNLVQWLLIKVVLPLGVVTLIAYGIISALGYEALSRWVLRGAGMTAGLILAAAVVYRFLRKRLQRAISFMRDERATADGEPAPVWIGVERILTGALKLALGVATTLVFLGVWNTGLGEAQALLQRPIFGGGLTWGTFVGGLLKVAVTYIAHSLLRDILIFLVFPRTKLEFGARYAILTVLRYAAVIIGILFAFSALGVDTSTLTVFAGGASVGLAFGMKDIFSNFFSGLIMLLERPVRVGDDIEAGGTRGKIEAIQLRGTRVRTFDGQVVIIPNQEMITSRIVSHSRDFKIARMQIDVGVAYDEDPRDVEKILNEVARSEPRVLRDPAPVVRFNAFGASSLDFTLRVWTRDIGTRWEMLHEMRTRVFEEFKRAGIEIPFPQTDLHIRSDSRTDFPPPPVPKRAPSDGA